MKTIKSLLLTVATLICAVGVGAAASGIYRHLRYPHVPVEETDVFFDIGMVFFLGFATVVVVAVIACVLQFRKRRALAVTGITKSHENAA